MIHIKIIRCLISDNHFNTVVKTLNKKKNENKDYPNHDLPINNYFQEKENTIKESTKMVKNDQDKIKLNENHSISFEDFDIERINLLIFQINKEKLLHFQPNVFNVNDHLPASNRNKLNLNIIDNEFQKKYMFQNIMEIRSTQSFLDFQRIKEKFCRECNEPALFNRYGKNIMKCLNCLKVKCKYCLKEIDENHFKLSGFNYCKVFYRRTLKLKYENPRSQKNLIKNFLMSFLLYSIAYFLLIANCIFNFRNLISKIIFRNDFTSIKKREINTDRKIILHQSQRMINNSIENFNKNQEKNLHRKRNKIQIDNLAYESNYNHNYRSVNIQQKNPFYSILI